MEGFPDSDAEAARPGDIPACESREICRFVANRDMAQVCWRAADDLLLPYCILQPSIVSTLVKFFGNVTRFFRWPCKSYGRLATPGLIDFFWAPLDLEPMDIPNYDATWYCYLRCLGQFLLQVILLKALQLQPAFDIFFGNVHWMAWCN